MSMPVKDQYNGDGLECSTNDGFIIDALEQGSIARFINSSCDSNSEVRLYALIEQGSDSNTVSQESADARKATNTLLSYRELDVIGAVSSCESAMKSQGKKFTIQVGIFSVRDIKPLEQVSINYNWYTPEKRERSEFSAVESHVKESRRASTLS